MAEFGLDNKSLTAIFAPSSNNQMLQYNSATLTLDPVTISGDITIAAGVAAIASNVIINTDINSAAAIAFSKLAALTSAHILVGSAGNVATDVAVTGDISLTNGGVTAIVADAVTFAKMQNIATDRLIGRDTAATGDPEEISLNATLEFTGSSSIQRAALTGDITASAGSNTTDIAAGVIINADVNASAAIVITKLAISGTPTGSKFLRDDASWQTIPGGGDALVANPLSQFAATTSAQLAGVISDETGSGALVFANTPTLVTPILGTPTSGTLTNCIGLPFAGLVSLTSGNILVGSAGNVATSVAMSGVIAISNAGLTTFVKKPINVVGTFLNAIATNTVLYSLIGLGNGAAAFVSATEGDVDMPIANAFVIIREFIYCSTNTKNGNSVVGFRDDGTTVQSITIAAGTTGTTDSGAVAVAVAGGSLCNLIQDLSASSSGAITLSCNIILESA